MPKNIMDFLYDTQEVRINDLLSEAHREGSLEIIETESGEGVVEDLIESQLKALRVALTEPTLKTIASLADKLDDMGFSRVASDVDRILKSFSFQDELMIPASLFAKLYKVSKADPGEASFLSKQAYITNEQRQKILDKEMRIANRKIEELMRTYLSLVRDVHDSTFKRLYVLCADTLNNFNLGAINNFLNKINVIAFNIDDLDISENKKDRILDILSGLSNGVNAEYIRIGRILIDLDEASSPASSRPLASPGKLSGKDYMLATQKLLNESYNARLPEDGNIAGSINSNPTYQFLKENLGLEPGKGYKDFESMYNATRAAIEERGDISPGSISPGVSKDIDRKPPSRNPVKDVKKNTYSKAVIDAIQSFLHQRGMLENMSGAIDPNTLKSLKNYIDNLVIGNGNEIETQWAQRLQSAYDNNDLVDVAKTLTSISKGVTPLKKSVPKTKFPYTFVSFTSPVTGRQVNNLFINALSDLVASGSVVKAVGYLMNKGAIENEFTTWKNLGEQIEKLTPVIVNAVKEQSSDSDFARAFIAYFEKLNLLISAKASESELSDKSNDDSKSIWRYLDTVMSRGNNYDKYRAARDNPKSREEFGNFLREIGLADSNMNMITSKSKVDGSLYRIDRKLLQMSEKGFA